MVKSSFKKCMVIAASALAVGCTSADSGGALSGSSDGVMVGAQTESYAFWQDWTPQPAAEMEVDEALRPAKVFDAWRIDDLSFQRPVFDATFHIVSAVDHSIDDEQTSQVLRSLLLRLDPDQRTGQISWELAFVSHAGGDAEGLVLRIVGADGAGLWIEAQRPAAGSKKPTQWILRAEPATKEVDGISARWAASEQSWEFATAPGADLSPTEQINARADWEGLLKLWELALWRSVTDREYLEPGFEFVESRDTALADGWPPSLGVAVEERGLTDFVDDTVFLPRGEMEFGE